MSKHMTSANVSISTSSRGTVVMLVDNPVVNDSRVQKQARSMAERGWSVTLLGVQNKAAKVNSWAIGEARIRLLPMPKPLSPRKHQYRHPFPRSLWAYRSTKRLSYRGQEVQAHLLDLRFRIADSRVRGRETSVFALRALLALRKVESRWVGFRSRRTAKLRERRVAMTAPIDRFTTWWWRLVLGDRCWRRLDPSLWDWEAAYGPAIDRLKPNIIHANDFRMLSVGARATIRARGAGRDTKLVWDAHEYLRGIKPWNPHPRWHLAMCAVEREFAPYADAVVSVTEQMAQAVADEHRLDRLPTVVLNAPTEADESRDVDEPNVRTACGLADDVPLLVYSGVTSPQRGVNIMIDALPLMPGTHVVAVVASAAAATVIELVERAAMLGVSDRFHVVPYVPVDQIVPYLATATVGVMPAHHWPNHEVTIATKMFEYSHARLPILVSDLKAMAQMVRSTGQGEVFVAEDLDDYVKAANVILADPRRYQRAYDDPSLLASWTWEPQADILDGVYTSLLR